MDGKKPVLAVLGPTASGKTALGIALALALGGEVVSCDSMQIYKGLPIGTAQPTEEEQRQVPHHLVGFWDVDEPFSVSDYVDQAQKVIGQLHQKGKLPVLVGGTGLYARSLLRGFSFQEGARDDALRARLFQEGQQQGPEALHARLQALDPAAAREIHPHNVKRVVRALEYCLLSGEPFSAQAARSQAAQPPYCALVLGTAFQDRAVLYSRIDSRVDVMMGQGLLEEARAFFHHCEQAGTPPTAAQAIGYKELFPYFRGEVSLEEAVARLKQESRRYAKRQLTWFSREPGLIPVYMDGVGGPHGALADALRIAGKWKEGIQ